MNISQSVNGAQTSPKADAKPVQSISSEEYAASERTLA
jgi:MFS transporter, ACS family, tartrate transporter